MFDILIGSSNVAFIIEEELLDGIQYYVNCTKSCEKRFTEIGNKIREDYFKPVTRQAVLKFLDIKQN